MTGKVDLNKLYHEGEKEGTEKQTKVKRALEGVVCGSPRNTGDDPILRSNKTQESTNG